MYHARLVLKKVRTGLLFGRVGLVLVALSALGGGTAIGQSAPTRGLAANVLIGSLALDTTYGNMVFISISQSGNSASPSPGYKTGNPTCSTNGPGQWAFVLPLSGALQTQMYAALLAAHNAGSPVTLEGSGLCDTFSTVETLVLTIV
jgi:hypothetical protein